jgi:hypothetical protein
VRSCVCVCTGPHLQWTIKEFQSIVDVSHPGVVLSIIGLDETKTMSLDGCKQPRGCTEAQIDQLSVLGLRYHGITIKIYLEKTISTTISTTIC